MLIKYMIARMQIRKDKKKEGKNPVEVTSPPPLAPLELTEIKEKEHRW